MTSTLTRKWDPKHLEIKTRSVENTLSPLVTQVTTLVNTPSPSGHPKGRSKRAAILVSAVEKATEALLVRGTEIAEEHPEYRAELDSVLADTRQAGTEMSHTSREFAEDPCSSAKRAAMVQAARALLCAVTRLLVLADMIDASELLKPLRSVQNDLSRIQEANSDEELNEYLKMLGANAVLLNAHAARRQAELKDARLKEDLAAARAVLKKNTMMLMTASRVYVQFPTLTEAKSNRDFIYKQVCEAVNTINDVARGCHSDVENGYEGPGELAAALDAFDVSIVMDPMVYREGLSRPALEERLESIISSAGVMADSSGTRKDSRERIVAECNAVRQALQDLLTAYMSNTGSCQPGDQLASSLSEMKRKTRDLRKELRKAVVDNVSDTYLETNVPLLLLIKAAKLGDENELANCIEVFDIHAKKLVEVAHLACSMSDNNEGAKLVRFAAVQIEKLCPQVINAAKILAAKKDSSVALENMEAFKQAWELQVRLLTEAVDDITTIDDFLAVSESHILEDVNKCVLAVQAGDVNMLDQTVIAIRGRAVRVCNVVRAEMDNYEPCTYTKKVLESVQNLQVPIMENFEKKVIRVVEMMMANRKNGDEMAAPVQLNENDFIEASHLVYNGVCEIRRYVLDDSETEPEYEENPYETGLDEYPEISGISNARDAYRMVSEEEKQKIDAQVETFRKETVQKFFNLYNRFDLEVEKWDDTGNEIIVIAKSMCMIMMEMTDFTRGKGPLKTTMDVINAAKKISDYGEKLDKLATKILEQCQESETKKDLIAYLKQIALYCHQLNITSKVKADVQNISGNLIVSGLDSATSLIQAAKNLMNAVVQAVKSSYVASTKYPRQNAMVSSPIAGWRMKAPEKKPLVRRENPEEARAKVRKGSTKKHVAPIKVLSEFQTDDDKLADKGSADKN